MRTSPVLAALLPLLLLLAALPASDRAAAAPVYFEEEFRGCGDGNAPSGWTHSPTGIGTIGCDDGEFYPDQSTYANVNGTESLQQRLTSSLIDTWLSPTFSISSATTFSLGFAVRFEAFPSSTFGGAFQFAFRDGSAAAGGFGTRDTGIAHTLDVNSAWDSTGFQLVLDTWYVVRFEINRTSDRYEVFVNDTQIDANGGEGGIDQSMAPGAGAHDIDEVTVSSRLSGKSWIDWIFTDDLTIAPSPDLEVSLCGEQPPERTLWDFNADSFTDIIWNVSAPTAIPGPFGFDSFVRIVPATGRVFMTPAPAAGVFPVTVFANVSSDSDSHEFDLTVSECDPFAWLREFGPAWVVFLVVAAVIVTLVLTLWRGAKARPGRRRP